MRDAKLNERRRKGVGFYCAAVVLVLILYVLSTGPVIALSIHATNKYNDRRIQNAAEAFYKPIFIVMKPFGRQRWAEYWLQTWLAWTEPASI